MEVISLLRKGSTIFRSSLSFLKGFLLCNDILISLRADHSSNVLEGRKTVELRRRPMRVAPGTRVWIYAKSPQARIEGLAVVGAIHECPLEELWSLYGDEVAITHTAFDEYMAGTKKGCAIIFSSVIRLTRSISLDEIRTRVGKFQPPQFFKRLG